MRAPAFWWREPGLASMLLSPLAAIYGAAAGHRLAQPGARVDAPVVCVGNLTLGGAGKTPTALAVARLLSAAGERPVFITRGYGGRMPGPLLVDAATHDAVTVGDEPLLLARAFPTVVARDRVAGARLAREQGASVIVMDDGFQNPGLVKDFSVLAVDGARGLGNAKVFPAGPLRVHIGPQLQRAQALLAIGEGKGATAAKELAAVHRLPLFSGRLSPDAETVESLRERRVLAFAGIGDPEKFFATLRAAGADVAAARGFADHHAFTESEAAELVRLAEAQGLLPVTTEKDFVRLAPHAVLRARTQVLTVTLALDDPEGFAAAVLRGIRKAA
jgi:tetraacyldisaccharide 4'-kinase